MSTRRCCVPSEDFAASCSDVSKAYPSASGPVQAVSDASLNVPNGRVTLLLGHSGSGKSTLLRMLAGIDRPDRGTIHVGTAEISRLGARARRDVRRRDIGYVFSRPSDNLLPYLSGDEQVILSARLRALPASAADGLLARLGLAERAHAMPADLSGGERQRLAFAAAAVGRPRLLVADEPTAELDAASVTRLLGVLREVAAEGSGVLVATHDSRLLDVADQVVRIAAGKILP